MLPNPERQGWILGYYAGRDLNSQSADFDPVNRLRLPADLLANGNAEPASRAPAGEIPRNALDAEAYVSALRFGVNGVEGLAARA